MATQAPPVIDPLPQTPDPNDRNTFNARAYPWSEALAPWATQVQAVGANVFANAQDAASSASSANTSKNAAATSAGQAQLAQAAAQITAGAVQWVSGTSYAVGAAVWSPVNFEVYRRKVAGAGTVDPSADPTNWALTGTNASAVRSVGAFQLDCAIATYFTKTVNGSGNFTFVNPPATGLAYAIALELQYQSGTVGWPASVRWPGNQAPVLLAGRTDLFVFTTSNGGATWRGVVNAGYTA